MAFWPFQDHNFAPPKRELEIGIQARFKRFEQTYK